MGLNKSISEAFRVGIWNIKFHANNALVVINLHFSGDAKSEDGEVGPSKELRCCGSSE